MSLRTRRGLGLLASITLVATACTSSATPSPITAPPVTTAPVTAPPVTLPPAATALVTAPPASETPAASAPAASETPAASAPAASETPAVSAPAASETPGAASPTPGGTPDAYSALFGSTYAPGQGTPGGTIVFGEWQPATELNPYFTTAFTDFEALGPVLESLINIDAQGKFIPDMLSEIPTPKNGDLVIGTPTGGFTMTLKLKPGLMWSDGTPLTLNDFKNTYDWAVKVAKANIGCSGCATMVPVKDTSIDPTQVDKYWGPDNQYIKSIDVSSDGLTATVTWTKNYAGWLGWVGNAILPPAILNAPIDATSLPKLMAVGGGNLENIPWSGPFVITGDSSDGIDYKRNDNYKAGSHPAYLDTLRFKFYGSKDGEIADFLSGSLDLAFDMTQADFPAIQKVDPSIGTAKLDSVWQYEHLDLQTAHSNVGLDDVNVRTAIAMAVDKADLTSVLFPGAGVQPACSPAPPGTWWRIETTCPAFDPTGAMALLDQAGWKVDPATGLRTKGKDTLHLQLCTTSGNPTRLTELSKLNSYLSAIGIPSDVQTADASGVVFAGWADTTPTTQCSIFRGTYDISDFAYVLGGDLYSNYYYAYSSAQIPSDKNPNGANDTRFTDKNMDAALNTLSVAVDPNDQFNAAVAVQQAYAAGVPEIPLYYRAETTGLGIHLGNWPGYNPSSAGPTWDTADWFHQ